ncbi:MAG: hypothetical protein RLP14_09900 [Owenweeksia sp.]
MKPGTADPMKKAALFLVYLLVLPGAYAQDEPKKTDLKGYVKLLGSFNYFNKDYIPPLAADLFPAQYQDYQIHNRFDFKYYPSKSWSLGAGMRNRLFWGYSVGNEPQPGQPDFYNSLDQDNGLVDLSYLYFDSDAVLLHTIFDRLWGQWESSKWIIRLGRQRINWGVNTVWNPNDIFNQYNYFDFDYEERPGSDALRVQYFPNFKSTLELGFAPAKQIGQSVAAMLYKANRWQYDFQFLAGYYKEDLTAGTGWAGSIKNVGFKGEANYYHPLQEGGESNFTASTALDYLFGFGLYTQLSYLYNGLGTTDPTIFSFAGLGANQVQGPKNIFPFKHTLFTQTGGNITPLFRADAGLMFTPDLKNIILFPTLTYSLASNLDALLALQYFISQNPLENNNVEWLSGTVFGRLKYSF